MNAIQSKEMNAFLLRGSLNAVIPFEIASIPVKAAVPLEKACRIKKGVIEIRSLDGSNAGGFGTNPKETLSERTKTTPTLKKNMIKKKKLRSAMTAPPSFT